MLNVEPQRPSADETVLRVVGEIDAHTASRLSRALHHELDERPAVVVLDLSGVSFVGVAGLRVLRCAADRAASTRVALRLVYPHPSPVRSALGAAGMTGMPAGFPTVAEALDADAGPAPRHGTARL